MMKIELRNAERGAITKYSAELYVDGEHAGYVQKRRGDDEYKAFADGLRIGSARTLTDVKDDIREYFEDKNKRAAGELEESRGLVWQHAFDAAKPKRRVSGRAMNDVVAWHLSRWIAQDPDRLAAFLSEHETS